MYEMSRLKRLQEVSFWQQLNNQLLSIKKQQAVIKKDDYKALQNFCFSNLVFSTINGSRVGTDLPLSLITNFKNLYVVTLNDSAWNKVCLNLLPVTVNLDIEKALANSFVAIKNYDRKHHILKDSVPDYDDDQELSDFIDRYIDEKDRAEMDIPSMVIELHALKTKALRKILKLLDVNLLLKVTAGNCFFDLHSLKKQDKTNKTYQKVCNIYHKEFIAKVDPIIEPLSLLTNLANATVIGLLENKLKEPALKKSIKDFAAHELKKCKVEIDMINVFSRTVKKTNPSNLAKINICSNKPFFFLSHPFPLI
jgi:hypothetical protein